MERGWTLLVLGTLCLSAYMHTCAATTTTAISSTITAGPAGGGGGNTGGGGCTDTFIRSADSGRQGGVRQTTGTGFFTQAQCQQLCLDAGRVNCAAFDWATVPGAPTGQRACWIHTQATVATNAITARPNEGIDHYTRMACDAATTTPTSTPAVGGCVDTFAESQNTNFNGGVSTPAAGNTATACQAYCLAQASCTGFDINTGIGLCWIFTQTTFTTGGNPTGVNHFRRQACNVTTTVTGSTPCVDSFNEERGMQLFNGVGRAGLDSVACLAACLAETFCTHYELSSSNQCFLHFNMSGETPTRITDQSHRLFIRQPCLPTSTPTGVCRDNFTPRANTNVFGGTESTGVTSVEACTSACLEITNPPCTAFDFASFGNARCFLFTSVNRQYVASSDVTHYERNFRCNGTVTGSTCVEMYTPTANSNRQGGVLQGSLTTNVLCAEACSNTQQTDSNACFGYDFNSLNNECYHFIGSLPTQTGAFPGVTSYARQFVCSRSTTLGGGCRDVYTATPNSNVFGGVGPQANANTETACRTLCSATIEGQAGYCFGYDFDSNSNQCFFIPTATYDISPGANGVTHYNRRRDCPGTAVTGSTCIEAYNATENRNAAGGTDIGAQTVETCTRECNNRTACFGFDIANGNCWLLLSDYTLNAGAANGVTNYRRQFNCGGTTTGSGCVPSYTIRTNIIVYGGVGAAGSDTVAACAVACNADANCVGYNFVRASTSGRCFLLQGSIGTENPNNDLDLYVQDNNCNGQTTPGGAQCRMQLLGAGNVNGGTFVPNTNTLQACQDWCIQNEPCQAVDWDATTNQCFWFTTTSTTASGSSCCQHFNKICENTCIDSFNVTVGAGFFSGIEVQNRATVMDCQTACLESELCAAFDFNRETGQCFTHVLANLDRGYSFAGVSNYRRVRCPGGTPGRTTLPTTIRTTSCPDRFTPILNSNAQGGTMQSSANTLAACQRVCSDDSLCTAIDFHPPTTGCWTHVGTPVVRTNQAPGVTHYQRTACQDTTPTPVTPSPQVCNVDIFFLVDAIDSNLLDQMGLVIQQVTYGLNVGNNNVRVGVRAFGNSNTQLFQYATIPNFITASVSAIRQEAGPNNLPLALQTFLSNEYVQSRSAGREVVLVLMTDLNVAPQYTGTLSNLRNQLTAIPTIFITFNNVLDPSNRNLINNFSPSRRQIFHQTARSVVTANDVISQINPLCRSSVNLTPRPSVVTPAPPTIAPRQCLGDVAIVIDDSGSIRVDASRGGVDNWPLLLNFVRDIIRSLQIGSENTRIALATFSNNASLIYRFSDLQSTAALEQRIQLNTIRYTGGNTNLMAALALLREQIFRPENGDRIREPNVVILITDGKPTGGNDVQLQQEIQRVRQIAEIIPVGVTSSVDTGILQLLASNPNRVFNVENFSMLSTIINQVVSVSCNALRR